MPQPMADDEWEDDESEDKPPHLRHPEATGYLVVVDVSRLHFWNVQYCNCPTASPPHIQLLQADLFPSTTDCPSMVFTFKVLDDFLRDNVECSTAAMNYFNKLRQITSNVFLDAVPV